MADSTKRKTRGGGPQTPEGKAVSSRNSLKHGMFAKTKILEDEDERDYRDLKEAWFEEIQPRGLGGERLVELLVDADWLFKRADRRLKDVEASEWQADQDGDEKEWGAEKAQQLGLLQRYYSSALRNYMKVWKETGPGGLADERRKISLAERSDISTDAAKLKLERMREGPAKMQVERPKVVAKKAEAKPVKELSRAQKLFQGQRHPKKRGSAPAMSQWVEVRMVNGKTVTKLSPPSEEMIKRGQKRWPAPVLVYRRFHFVNGVPPEYHWCTSDPTRRANGGGGVQRMTADAFLEVIEREKAMGAEHVGPVGVGNLPGPQQRGGCECPVCTQNKPLLEKWAQGDLLTPSGVGAVQAAEDATEEVAPEVEDADFRVEVVED